MTLPNTLLPTVTVILVLALTCRLGLGTDWTAVNNGLANLDVRIIDIHPINKETIYAGGAGGLFKSIDGGLTWNSTGLASSTVTISSIPGLPPLPTPIVSTSAVVRLAIDSINPKTLYAATLLERSCVFFQRRVFKSTDGGATWTDSVSPNINGCDNIHALVLAPSDPATLYITNFDDTSGDTWSPVIRTTDRAETWTYLGYPVLNVLAVDPLDSRIVYGGTFDFEPYYTDLANGVLKSSNGGATWEPTGLSNVGISALTVDPRNSRVIYAATGRIYDYNRQFQGLFKTIDGGPNWVAINRGLSQFIGSRSNITALVVDSDDPNVVYLAMSGGGIFRSIDGGTMWSAFNDGLGNLNVRSLALAPGIPNTLYAATPSGVFKITDDLPVLAVETEQCLGSAWTLRLSKAKPNAPAKLLGSSNDRLWEVPDWNTTDASGALSQSGTFTVGAEGKHSLRIEVGGVLSNSVSFVVSDCRQ